MTPLAGARAARRAPRALVAAALTVLVGVLAACGPAQEQSTDTTDDGYVSGDGSTKTWAPGDRQGPVELAGTDYEGTAQDVASWRGDVVVLNTWYAACPPCRAEAPDLVAFANEYAEQGVRVLGLNSTDEAGAAQAFQRTFDVPYPSLEDTSGQGVLALQGVVPLNAVPTTVVLDREGKVAARVVGLLDASTLRTVVDDLLAEPVPS
ncbi:TlpA family protein disulfide reductase [Cellulomonas uda]|uniref:Thiol-disulfide isomerase n=1 Tax=Cellulomonas uda TaxID=1714 RepID=A0A4Y3KD78_CELUD|nr:peroxiredoxin [Cellulomonas uda]GEA80958.1 thiol-disulfide isomerase [Cellulomonas uda]